MEHSEISANVPDAAKNSVLLHSEPIDDEERAVIGPAGNINKEITIKEYCKNIKKMGFQATNIGRAIEEIKRMLSWRLFDEEIDPDDGEPYNNIEYRKSVKCTIWLSFTSNMISSGLREIFVYLAKNKLVDVIVTSAGGVEEDFIKVLGDTFIGDFTLKGSELRSKGWNRIGNLLVPNQNYVKFEEWLQPLLDEMLEIQNRDSVSWTPSRMIHFLGEKINHEDSLYYWCYKNNIPVFCPGITDGSLGDNLFFHSYRNPVSFLSSKPSFGSFSNTVNLTISILLSSRV